MNESSVTNGDMSSNPIGDTIDLSQYDLGPDTPDTHRVFVYGTLKRGHGNNRLLVDSAFAGTYTTDEPAFDMCCNGSFPYALIDGSYRLVGEVYHVDDAVLQRLDRLEGYPRFYSRKQISVNGLLSWMYFYPLKDGEGLPGKLESPRIRHVNGTKIWN